MSMDKILAALKGIDEKQSAIESRVASMEKARDEKPATDNVRSLLSGTQPPAPTTEQRRVLKAENKREAMRLYARGLDPFEGRGIELGQFLRVVALHKRNAFPNHSLAQVAERVGGVDFAQKIDKHERALGESTFTDGGAVIPEVLAAQLIEFLRAKSVLMQLGVTVLPMPNGNIAMPRMTDGSAAYYKAENQAGTVSQPDFGQRRLSAKTLTSIVPASNELLSDAPEYFDLALRDDIVRAVSVRRDLAGIRGTGTDDEPLGLKNLMTAGNAIAATAGSTPSVTTIDDECGQLEGAVEDANIPMERCGYIMHPRTKRYLYNLRDGVGGYLYRDELRAGKFRGYAFAATTNVPKNLGSGDDSELYFGDFAQFVMGDTLDMQVDFFPNGTYHDGSAFQSGINNNESVFRALSRHDFQLKHPDAFAMLTGVEWGA